jgi:ferric-dicitrate binding protein FerR (iron transport regulator)
VNVTRDVIRDLSSLVAAGEASDDSRQLVNEYLANDPAFAQSLTTEDNMLNALAPELPTDHEAKTLTRMKRQLDRRSPIRILALGFTGLTIARLIEHTTFTQSPTEVILLAIIAAALWIAHAWHTRRLIRRGVFAAK